jgi:DNA polymerase-3 subunit delta
MSSAAGLKLLSSAIKQRVFAPAYLLHGADDLRKQEALDALLTAALDPGTRDFNLEQRRGAEMDAETLASVLNTPPLMSTRRAVVVRDVNALRKDARAALDRYLARSSPDTLLVMTLPVEVEPDASMSEAVVRVELGAMDDHEIPRWITQRVERQGGTITSGALDLLHEGLGTDLGRMRVEIEKLIAYSGARPIDEAAVTAVVGVRSDVTMLDFLRAVWRRDATRAAAMAPGLLEQPRSTAVFVVMALSSSALALSFARGYLDRGRSRGALRNELFQLLRGGGSVYGLPWGALIDLWMETVDLWTAVELDDTIRRLLAADRALKESRVSTEDQVLASLAFGMCAREHRREAA